MEPCLLSQKFGGAVSICFQNVKGSSHSTRPIKCHCCAMTLEKEGVGYPDLNQLMNSPHDLEFTIELLKVEPEQYQKKHGK